MSTSKALTALGPRLQRATGTGLIRFTIQFEFIYSICQILYFWPGRGITPDLSDGGEPQAGSTCALAGLQHIARTSLLEVGASLVPGFPALLSSFKIPGSRRWLRYYAFVRAPVTMP